MDSRPELVDHLLNSGYIESKDVEKAFRKVDRANFVPLQHRDSAYEDRPIPTGENATISAPHMVAINTELLEIEESSKVVEIGSGSGYQAAILSELAEEVVGIEILEELVKSSRKALNQRDNVRILHGSGLEPLEDRSFDKILYSVATKSFEDAKQYLRENGMIVAPVRQNGYQVLKKFEDGEVTDHGRVRFVEMV